MKATAEIISAFKKFARGASLESNYRVATVDEVEQLLKAIRSTSSETTNVVCDLLPSSKNEVFSLKDGYLFDFGTIRTFYPDIDNKFLLTHKLGVSLHFPEVEAELCLPLALLHACAEEDEKEIRDLVMVQSVRAIFGRHLLEHEIQEVPRTSLNRGFVVVQHLDGIKLMDPNTNYSGLWGSRRVSAGINERVDSIAKGEKISTEVNYEGEGKEKDHWPSSTTGVLHEREGQQQPQELGYWPPEKQTISPLGARLALLHAHTVWPKNGGTALHFAAGTRRTRVVELLLALELQLMQQISRTSASSSRQSAAAALPTPPSYMLFSLDCNLNNPLCCAAEAQEDNTDIVNLLLCRDNREHWALLQQNNLGMTALLIAASTGHMSTFHCLLQAHSSICPLKSHNFLKKIPGLEFLEGNSFMHYCVERADIHQFNEILSLFPLNWHSIAHIMFRFSNHLGVTAFELALKKGRSDICKLVLEKICKLISEGEMEIGLIGVEFMMDRCKRDCDGNNILHLYAFGGGSKEVGEQLTQWVQLLKEWHERYKLTGMEKDLYGLNTMEAMINQLNCAGETPYITALKKGHSDALQVLMPFWTEELASQYLNPETWDTVLHSYAKSSITPSFDHSFFTEHTTSYLEKLINTSNEQGHTPILSSLYSGQTTCLAWLLKQKDVQILPEDHALHVYAYYCDDEEVGKALLAKLGHEKVQVMINESILLTLQSQPEMTTSTQELPTIKGTPLMLAVAQGNLQTCGALLGVDGIELNFESVDDHQNNVLHLLCKNKNANIDQFWQKLAAKVIGKAEFAEHLINARNKDEDTPLSLALRCGNTKACEWLLETHSDLLFIDPQLDATAVFDHFKEGACMDLVVWKKLKTTYCKCDETLLEYADEALKHSLLNAFSNNFEDFVLRFMMEEDVITILDEDDTSLWLRYLEHVSRLRSLNALIEMRRQRHWSLLLHHDEILHVAAKQGSFELLDMALQAQSYEQIEEEFNKDQYQTLLRCVLSSPIPGKLTLFLVKKIHMENCTSLVISWQRFLKLMAEQYDAIEACIWAISLLLVQRPPPHLLQNNEGMVGPMLPLGQQPRVNINIQAPQRGVQQQADAEIQHIFIEQQENHFIGVLKFVVQDNLHSEFKRDYGGVRNLLSMVKVLSQNPKVQEEGISLLKELLISIQRDIPELVSLLLLLFFNFPFIYGALFDTVMIRVIRTYSKSGLLHNVHAAMHFMFTKVHITTSQQKAFLNKPADSMGQLPILPIICTRKCSVVTFIKVLNFAQSCQAEGMVDYQGRTALHYACEFERHEIFLTLIFMCPHLVDVVASRGMTPLMFAAMRGSSRMVEYLLQLRKRDLSFERDADGRTPLHYAAQSSNLGATKVVELLLNHARKNEDSALLLWATAGAFGTADVVAVKSSVFELLQNEMKNEKKSRSDLLQLGKDKENMVMVRDLINRGADISILDSEYLSDLGLYETKQLDQATSKDSLGRASLAKGIASLFLNPFAGVPITVGVLGAWGMGKSSIMLQTEIILVMTIIERNLLSTKEDFPSKIQDKITTREVEKLQHYVVQAVEELTHQQQFKEGASQPRVFCDKWLSQKKKNKATRENIEDFVSIYRPQCMPLYKGLAMMNRHKLFQCPSFEKHHQASFALEIPSCLTIYYNAWLYHGENDASSGLALTVMKELEGCMNTAQWLKLCWSYAYRLDPIFVFSNITLPFVVLVVIGGWIVWIIWKLLSLPSLASQEGLSSFKYGSIPVSTIIIAWIILRNIINVLKPVSEQIMKSLNTSQKYEERLGYQQQIINDIQFFKEQLGEETGFGWKMLGKIWNLVVENKDKIPKSNIKKVLVSKDKLRIIVFIDDLDRCSKPTYVLELLGATNLILSVCAINVVLGMDKEMIKEIISSEYKGNIEATQKFLEKIIHVPIDLYEPSEEEMSIFLEEQLIGKSKKKKTTSSLFNQGGLNIPHERKMNTMQVNSASPHSISHNETMLLKSHSREIQPLQGHFTIDLQEASTSNFGSHNQERKATILKTQASDEGSSLPIHHQEWPPQTCESTSSRKNLLYDQRTSSTPQDQHQSRIKEEGYNKENNKLVVEFPLLVANYNESEVRVFTELQKKAKAEKKQPRNWKRLLSYHQLVRSIISQSKIERLSRVFGWQEQLIIWLFVCYNWKEQMNQIFENWGKLVKIPESPSTMPEPSLHHIVLLQMQILFDREMFTIMIEPKGQDEILNKERGLIEWVELERTLYGAYDVDIWSVDIFQKYRFHCNIGHLHWEDGMVLSEMIDDQEF